MKIVTHLFRGDTRAPMLALSFASIACAVLVAVRVVWTDNVRYGFLLWNLFLAWLPLLLARGASERGRRGTPRDWRFAGLAAAWLLFFPNAPYMFTDLIHLTQSLYRYFWVDLSLVLLCAWTGFVLGFVSLYLMQGVVRQAYGPVVGWVFVAGVAGLAGFGTYLGRFLRFNSWDVLARPVQLSRSIGAWMANPAAHPSGLAFAVLFGIFLFIAYVMLYALTHLPKPASAGRPANRPAASQVI